MSDDRYEAQRRERELDLQSDLESNRLDIDFLRSGLEAERLRQRKGRGASEGGSLTDHVLYWRQDLLKLLLQSDEGRWIARMEGEDWEAQLEALREHAEEYPQRHLFGRQYRLHLYEQIAARVVQLQGLLAGHENKRAQWAVRVRAGDHRPWPGSDPR